MGLVRYLWSLEFVSFMTLSLYLSMSVSVCVYIGHFSLAYFRSLCGQWYLFSVIGFDVESERHF